jgi:acyl transferase
MSIIKLDINFDKNNYISYNAAAYCLINKDSKNIFIIESKTQSTMPKGNVVIIPPYGINSHELFLLSYYFTENGFNVYRFDGINNVGISSGTIKYYTLGQLENDTNMVIDTLLKHNSLPLIILTQSLSFPVALKYSCYYRDIAKIIAIVGVVNVKDTIERVSKYKYSIKVYENREANAPKYQDMFGHRVLAQKFVDDIIKNSFTYIENTIQYFEKSSTPVYMISGQSDEYVNYNDILKVKKYIENRGKLLTFPELSHMVGRSVSLVKKLAKSTVEFAIDPTTEHIEELKFPKLTDVIKTASIEAEFINKCENYMNTNFA